MLFFPTGVSFGVHDIPAHVHLCTCDSEPQHRYLDLQLLRLIDCILWENGLECDGGQLGLYTHACNAKEHLILDNEH